MKGKGIGKDRRFSWAAFTFIRCPESWCRNWKDASGLGKQTHPPLGNMDGLWEQKPWNPEGSPWLRLPPGDGQGLETLCWGRAEKRLPDSPDCAPPSFNLGDQSLPSDLHTPFLIPTQSSSSFCLYPHQRGNQSPLPFSPTMPGDIVTALFCKWRNRLGVVKAKQATEPGSEFILGLVASPIRYLRETVRKNYNRDFPGGSTG